jgi:hypothetical protein
VDLSFSDDGSPPLRSVAKLICIFIWHADANTQHELASERLAAVLRSGLRRQLPSVVVLPFENVSTVRQQANLADAVVGEIIATPIVHR